MKFHYPHDPDDEPNPQEEERYWELYEEACIERAEREREEDYDHS